MSGPEEIENYKKPENGGDQPPSPVSPRQEKLRQKDKFLP
jgi:hypothetical protein